VNPVKGVRERYFLWLYDQSFDIRSPESDFSYVQVCDILHTIRFADSVQNDRNRTADGEELRDEFISLDPDIDIVEFTEMAGLGKATLFEVLAGLSRRAGAVTEALKPEEWFRLFLRNLGLLRFPDSSFSGLHISRVNRIAQKFNSRTYDPDGKGGIFPLKHAQSDQRVLELWFQMAAYINENQMY
jgi:hypothetical protein